MAKGQKHNSGLAAVESEKNKSEVTETNILR
jgi:hypothetical protein